MVVLDAFVTLLEVILLALCVPMVIVLVGLPVVLLVRLILEMAQRF